MSIEFEDNSEKIKQLLHNACVTGVTEAGIEMLDQVQKNTKVVTGRTKGSWQLDTEETFDSIAAYIGSDYENSVWEEFGTGEYALHGDGRKGGWFYEDAEGKGHFTHGKEPKRPLQNAFVQKKLRVLRLIGESIGRMLE
ncbi:MAG: hypothetical protein MR936_14945 [Eubacterium sp.]|nr:hypothetical protein [Eubacterium sp.]